MMQKIKLFILKFLVNRYGVILEKQWASLFVLKGTNVQIPMYPSVKAFLRKHHRIHKSEKVEILIKPNDSLKNKLDRKGNVCDGSMFYRDSVYLYRGTTWQMAFCDSYLLKLFGYVPEKISYEVNFIKSK